MGVNQEVSGELCLYRVPVFVPYIYTNIEVSTPKVDRPDLFVETTIKFVYDMLSSLFQLTSVILYCWLSLNCHRELTTYEVPEGHFRRSQYTASGTLYHLDTISYLGSYVF